MYADIIDLSTHAYRYGVAYTGVHRTVPPCAARSFAPPAFLTLLLSCFLKRPSSLYMVSL
jgi:hypothetical protein